MVKISVIMGVYNSGNVVTKAIDSILKQTFTDFEFIICDDNSQDNTYDVIKNLEKKDKRIVLIKNEKNLGLAKTLNRCIAIAKGEFIARMDDDDISHPIRFEKQINFMLENPEYAVVGTGKRYFDESGVWKTLNDYGPRTVIDIYKGKNFTHPSVMMKKESLLKVGSYTESLLTRRGQDFDLWCKLYFNGYKGFNMNEVLLDYYESKESVKRRKFKYRITIFINKLYWRKKLKLNLKYDIYAFKEIVVGLVPQKLLLIYKMKKTQSER